MNTERRSLYRILHVQPEAPAEIIAAAYRCLMTKLRHHPDLGGDHETAVRINRAYAVLSDPTQRQAYDVSRRSAKRDAGSASAGVGTRAGATRSAHPPERSCPFCHGAIPRIIATETRCRGCDSPLAPIAHSLATSREQTGRRAASRVNRNEAGVIYPAPRRKPSAARLRDLSPTGISLYTAAPIAVGATVRVVMPSIDLVAHVVQVRAREQIQLVHARLLTARFTNQPGMFVSVAV